MIDVNMREGKIMQGDVSFTLLDRIEEVELNIVDRRWQSALALALTLPDICGERCWQLRCEYLHQNKGFLNDENNIHFHLGLNCGMSFCQLDIMLRRKQIYNNERKTKNNY